MQTIEQLRHTLTFLKGTTTIDGTGALVSAEVTVPANATTKCNLVLAAELGVGVGDSFTLALGYHSSLWTLPSKPTLSLGSSGSDVLLLEQLLKHHGALLQTPASTFDSDTRAALILFQGWYGLTADGVCGPVTWTAAYRNSHLTPINTGRFYIDSYRRTDELITLDAVQLKIPGVTNAPVTQVSLTYTASIADCGVRLGYPVIPDTTGTFQVGTAPNPQQNVENKSSTSAADLLFKTGQTYGNYNFIWDDRIFTRYFQAFWTETNPVVIYDTDILEIERANTSIDAPKQLLKIQWKANLFYDYTIPYTTYGYTLSLESEGFQHEEAAATRRLRGATIEGIKDIASVRVVTYGRLGNAWLPCRTVRLYQQDGTTLTNFWTIREHVLRYSASGFTSAFLMQAMQV
jgi:peptidoglycan hydrolase-like protein with peptidoglycan-binding domain